MLSGWSYRVQVTINSSHAGGVFTDFPIYLNLALMPSGFFANVKSDGSDIRVTTSDGNTEVPIEVSTIDKANGRGRLYFKGSISNVVNTIYYVYFGNASAVAYAATDTYGRNNVWVNAFDARAVYHLDGHNSSTVFDSTGRGINGTIVNSPSTIVDANMGVVTSFDGTSQYVNIPGAIIDRTTSYSTSIHLMSHATTATRQCFMGLWGTMDGGKMRKLATSGQFEFSEYSGSNNNLATTTAPADNVWHHHVGTRSKSQTRRRAYVDAVLVNSAASSPDPNEITISSNAIAARPAGSGMGDTVTEYADILASEVRVYNTELTQEWITAEYNNIHASSSFSTQGSVETLPATAPPEVETLSPTYSPSSVTLRGRIVTVGGYNDVKGYFRRSAPSLVSPYSPATYNYKVNLHSHTNQSDGLLAPPALMQQYETGGYVANAKTDHDTYGGSSLDDPAGHNIIHIPGTEYSSGPHLGAVGITAYNNRGANQRQAQIDSIISQGGIATINHPSDGWTTTSIMALTGFTHLEMWNARYPNNETYFDYVLTQGRRIFGTANDDFHTTVSSEQFRGWNVIRTNIASGSLTWQDIVAILKAGNYYMAGRAQNTHPDPPVLDIVCKGRHINVYLDKACTIQFIRQGGEVAQVNNNVSQATYTYLETDAYIRVKATYTNVNESWAWSQPIYADDLTWTTTTPVSIPSSDYTFTSEITGLSSGNVGEFQAVTSYNGDASTLSGTILDYEVPTLIDITLTATNVTKTYGDTVSLGTSAWTVTSGSVQAGDITGVTLTSSGAASTANVGTYSIVPSGATGPGIAKYNITYVNGTLTVNKKNLAVQASNKRVNLNDPVPTLTVSYSGFVNGDTYQSLDNTGFSLATTYTQGSAEGSYPITLGIGTATDNNYNFSPLNNGTVTVGTAQTIPVPVGTKWSIKILV